MDHLEQRVVLRFLFLQGLRYKRPPHNYPRYLENTLLTFASKGMDPSVQGRRSFMWRRWLYFPWNRLLALDVLGRQEKFNQDRFFTTIAPELSKENSNSKRRVDKKELIVHMDNSMCHSGGKIQKYFARPKWQEPPFNLFPRSVTVWLLVLRSCQRATERPTNHGRERLGRQIDR
jgi:hypothetical protein